MADGITLNSGSGGAVLAADDIAGTWWQYVKNAWGPADTANIVDAASGKALPVQGEAAHDAATTGNPIMLAAEAKNQDGAALPNAVSAEADVVRLAASLSGVLYVMPVNEDGSAVASVVADLGATDNAVLDAIAASTAAADTDLTTIIGHVDGIEGLLTTIDADTGGMVTSLALLGDVVYAEDVAAQAADKGISVLAVRRDTASSMVGADNDYTNLIVDANGRLHVIDVNGAAIAASLSVVDDWDNGASDGASVSGDVAHDSADAGEPVKNGFKAIDVGTQPTAVANNDRSDWYGTRNGVAWVLGGSPATLTKELNVTDADGAQTDAALITVSAGTAIVVTAFQAMCDGANTGDVAYRCGFGTANTPAADAAGIISSHPGVKSGSGVVVGNGGGVIGMGASNEDLRVTCEDPAGGAINFIITYHLVLIG